MKKKGFTLVELMIVVAIIGILAAIAIPSFMAYIKKSKKSEVEVMVSGIFAAQADYNIDNAKFHHIPTPKPANGAGDLNGSKVPGSQGAFAGDTNGFKIIGYVPDQDTYGAAKVDCDTGIWDPTTQCEIFIYQDLDDDATVGTYQQGFMRDKNNTGDAFKNNLGLVTTVED
ncbi:MAG: prepilin-type N-terminal cleavage/methylation domain-containing protein [Pseudomonadota bacterium]